MKTHFITIKQLKTPVKITNVLYVYDFVFVVVFAFVLGQLSFLVHPWLEIPYYAVCVVWGIFFTLHSRFNTGKRNWETIIIYLSRNRTYYKDKTVLERLPKGEKTI